MQDSRAMAWEETTRDELKVLTTCLVPELECLFFNGLMNRHKKLMVLCSGQRLIALM